MQAPAFLIRSAFGASFALLFAVTAAAQETDRPTVLKGMPATPAAGPGEMEEVGRRLEVAAGEDLWLIDAAAGELVACRLLNTSTVGKRVIRCFAERLPERFRD